MSKGYVEDWVEAQSVEAWSVGFMGIGKPKVHIVCGRCSGPSASRDWATVTTHGDRIAVFCPHCRTWNLTELVRA